MEPTTLMEPTTVMKRSSTSSGCSGSDKSCKKHSDSNAVTVWVAVAIPVGSSIGGINVSRRTITTQISKVIPSICPPMRAGSIN